MSAGDIREPVLLSANFLRIVQSTGQLHRSEADRVPAVGQIPEEPYETATGEERQLRWVLTQRHETKIPFAVAWSRTKPLSIRFGIKLLKDL